MINFHNNQKYSVRYSKTLRRDPDTTRYTKFQLIYFTRESTPELQKWVNFEFTKKPYDYEMCQLEIQFCV